jgi:hypothetical protein
MKENKWVKSIKLKAFGLAEVLIGLAITGGVLITITSVGLSAYRQVKDNELGDYANNVMLMGVEFFKTPLSDVTDTKSAAYLLSKIDNNTTGVFIISSEIDVAVDDATQFAITRTQDSTDTTELKKCDVDDNYQVNFDNVKNKFQLCNKIVITRSSSGYFITSYVAYKTGRGVVKTSQIIGYRQKI